MNLMLESVMHTTFVVHAQKYDGIDDSVSMIPI